MMFKLSITETIMTNKYSTSTNSINSYGVFGTTNGAQTEKD